MIWVVVASILALAGQDAGAGEKPTVFLPPPPPPASGVAVLDCKLVKIDGVVVDAEIRLDYGKSRFAPWVSIKSSSEEKLRSMPLSQAFPRRDSHERWSGIKLPSGEWQSILYRVMSSETRVTSVEIHKLNFSPSNASDSLNSLYAAGPCSVKLEGSK